MAKPKDHARYLIYVLRHKYFVFLAGMKIGASPWRLLIHDLSKFGPSEWGAYVEYFYGEKKRLQAEESDDCVYFEKVQKYRDAFDAAWNHHLHNNLHHWQYWLLREKDGTKGLPIPEAYIREMVADWAGAGRAITGKWDIAEWYADNEARIVLHPATRLRVVALIYSYTRGTWFPQTSAGGNRG